MNENSRNIGAITFIQNFLKNIIVNYFWVLILLWAGLTIYAVQESNQEVAAALIGAGPLTLYYLYEELAKKPVLSISDGIEYEKDLFIDTDENGRYLLYPVINVFAELQNNGRSTARECFCQFSIGDEEQYEGRWGGGRDTEEIDIHPGRKERVQFMRLVPTIESLEKINQELTNRGKQMDIVDRFLPLNNSRNSYESREILGFMFDIQVPVPESAEISKIERRGRNPEERRKFFGTYIDPNRDLTLSAQFGANDWQMKKRFDPIDIEKAVERASWADNDPEFQDLREILNREDWKNR